MNKYLMLPSLTPTRWILLLGLVFAMVMLPTAVEPLFGQEPAAENGEEAAEEEPIAVDTTFFGLFQQGGWAMYPLLILSMLGIALIVFNVINLKAKAFYAPEVLPEIRGALENLDIEQARSICEANPSVVTNVTLAGLDRIGDTVNLEAVERAMEEASSEELAGPFVFINYLSIVGSVSPMMGMLGTVSGMISGFRVLMVQGMADPGTLAGSISEALITTATGLIVGIPAMIAYFYFKSRYGMMASRVARYGGDVYYSLVNGTQRNYEEQSS